MRLRLYGMYRTLIFFQVYIEFFLKQYLLTNLIQRDDYLKLIHIMFVLQIIKKVIRKVYLSEMIK